MTASEWDGLVWWEQRLLREGLLEEFGDGDGQEGSSPSPEAGQTAIDGSPGEFAALGLREYALN